MAVSTPRARSRIRVEAPPPPQELPIGDPETAVTTCPACGRPIAAGSGRCPGCGAYLLLGVPARRASVFISLGVAIGLLAGASAASAVIRSRTLVITADPGGTAGLPGLIASPSPTATSAPSVDPTTSPNPPNAVAGLSQTPTVNLRLLVSASVLRAQLAGKGTDPVDIALTLRAISSDALLGTDLANRMVGWTEASTLRADLTAFYASVQDSARDGLAAPITDRSAATTAASRMLVVLGGIGAIDAETQRFAASVGLDLPSALPASVKAPSGSAAP
jgi:hypothetical protein